MTADDLISPGTAARMLGVGDDAITAWADAGRLKTSRTGGGHRRFRRADIEALMAADLIGSQAAARTLGVHIATVYRYIASGHLQPAPWPGAQHRFRRADVLALLNRGG